MKNSRYHCRKHNNTRRSSTHCGPLAQPCKGFPHSGYQEGRRLYLPPRRKRL